MSDRSRYMRFFSAFKTPPPTVVARLSDADGHDHIGWGAIRTDLDDHPAIGAAHAVRLADTPDRAELAVAVLDEYHGLGLSKMLIAAVLFDCAGEDLPTLEMHLLGENNAAAGLVAALGAKRSPELDMVAHYQLDVATAIATLRGEEDAGGPRRDRGVRYCGGQRMRALNDRSQPAHVERSRDTFPCAPVSRLRST